jgi:hypothetical protein
VLDVKYDSTHVLDGPWAQMGHVTTPEDGGGDPQLVVSIDELLYYLELCRAEDELVHSCVAGYDLMHTVEYEDLFPRLGAPPAEAEIGRIAEWLGIDPNFDANPPALRKLAVRPLRDTIANYDDVAAALTGTRYEPMLDDERMYRSAALEPG